MKESSIDLAILPELKFYYNNLQKIELNTPTALKSILLEAVGNEKIQGKTEEACILDEGDDGIFRNGIPFHHLIFRTLTAEEKERVNENGSYIKAGRFSPEEDDIIRKNWADFCKLTDWDIEDTNTFFAYKEQGKNNRRSKYLQAWMSRGIMDRTGVQVIRRCHVIYHPGHQTEEGYNRPWTKEECDKLLKLVSKHPSNWALIGRKLTRPRYICRRRYNSLQQYGYILGDEEIGAWVLLYKYMSQAIGGDVVRVYIRNSAEEFEQHVINWDECSRMVGWSASECKSHWVKIKEALPEKSKHISKKDFKKMCRNALPEPCRKICKLQNKRKARVVVESKDFSRIVSRFLDGNHHLDSVNKPHSFVPLFIQDEKIGDIDIGIRKSVARRLNLFTYILENHGFFTILPTAHCSIFEKAELCAYLARKVGYKSRSRLVIKYLLKYLTKKGWKPRKQVVFCQKRN